VAGVDADTDARFVVHLFNHGCELLKAVAHVASLSSCVFNDSADTFGFGEREVDRFSDGGDAFVFGAFFQMTAGVKIEPVEAELFAALHFVEKGGARFFEAFGFGMAEVNQIAIVRENLVWRKNAVAICLKRGDGFVGERGRFPLPLIFGEERKGGCANDFCIVGGVLNASARADMGSDKFHKRGSFQRLEGFYQNLPTLGRSAV